MDQQLSLFPEVKDSRPPTSVTWNAWHGCTPVSTGCLHCYMFRRDREYGHDPSKIHKTANFSLPVRRYRSGEYKGLYKIPPGSIIYTCFTSDFFHPAADEWRRAAWAMIKERNDCYFFIVTKRPERIASALPGDWSKNDYGNVEVSCTCENQSMADIRLPVFLSLPLPHKSITHEPMLEAINIRKYLEAYGSQIESVSCGGESGPDARLCDYDWILGTYNQCREFNVPFIFHQTGSNFKKGNKIYNIPRIHQHTQAHKANLDYGVNRTTASNDPDEEY